MSEQINSAEASENNGESISERIAGLQETYQAIQASFQTAVPGADVSKLPAMAKPLEDLVTVYEKAPESITHADIDSALHASLFSA